MAEEVRVISDVATLKVIADPFRMKIIEAIGRSRATVKMIGARLGENVHKLYYHIKLLEEHELIVPVETNLVSGIVEKTYSVAAKRFEIKRDLLSAGDDGKAEIMQVAKSILESALESLHRAFEAGRIGMSDDKRTVIAQSALYLTTSQAEELAEKLQSIPEDYRAEGDTPGTEEDTFGLTIVFHPKAERGDAP